MKKSTLIAMTFAATCLGAVPAVADESPAWLEDSGLKVAPKNPEFERYIQDPEFFESRRATGDGQPLGLIPEPMQLPPTKTPNDPESRATTLPQKFDLRRSTPVGVTPVRNQGPCGSCWAFGTIGSLESYLKFKRGLNRDYSEADLNENHGFDFPVCQGGNASMTTAYMSRWSGPILEVDAPYPYWVGATQSDAYDMVDNIDMDADAFEVRSAPGVDPAYHIQNVWYLVTASHPMTLAERNLLKSAVYSNGAVNVSYFHDNAYYDSSNRSFYNTSNTNTNHSVTLVGWDDTFDKRKFKTPAPGNGAFIIKNSWGTEWGDSGYFYISYYDKSLRGNAQFLNAEPVSNYSRIYQYDPLGWVSSYGYDSDSAWFSNLFMASRNASRIKAVSFYTPVSNSEYLIHVYSNPNTGDPNSGTLVSSKTGKLPRAGYNTVLLPSIVDVIPDKPFSVVVKLRTPNYHYPIPAEYAYAGYTSAASSAPGQSYTSRDGLSWYSAGYNFNVALKALAVQ